jgi:hypothetical protein
MSDETLKIKRVTTDPLDDWRAWARDELFQSSPDPCAALILVLIDDLRKAAARGVTPEMIEAGWRAYWESGLATETEKLKAAYRAMRALEP